MRQTFCHFTHRFAKFGTIPLQMNPKNVHFQSSKDQEWRSLPCVYKNLQRRSFCKIMLPNRTPCKTMLPIESAEGPRSQRKRPFYALCDTIYCKPMVPVVNFRIICPTFRITCPFDDGDFRLRQSPSSPVPSLRLPA